jgi:hypothetical protein
LGGKEGKPFFVAGPHDNADRIIRILERKVGHGNYNYFVPIGDPGSFDDGDWDEVELLE